MEVTVEAKVFLVNMLCEKCNEGYMLDETTEEDIHNTTMMYQKPLFIHKCNKCGHHERYDTSYPYPKMIPMEE